MDVFKLLRKTLSFKLCWEIMKIEKSEDNLSEIGHFKALHSFGEVNESFGPFYFRIAFWTFPCYFVLSVFKTLWKSMDWILLYLCNWKFQFFFFTARVLFQRHLQFWWQQGKGRDHPFSSVPHPPWSQAFKHLFQIFMWNKYHIKLLLNEINKPHELPFDWLMMWWNDNFSLLDHFIWNFVTTY